MSVVPTLYLVLRWCQIAPSIFGVHSLQRFGEKLRTLRKTHGLTLKQLAKEVGLSAHSHLSELETGKSYPTTEIVIKIARLFNVSTDQLLFDELDVD